MQRALRLVQEARHGPCAGSAQSASRASVALGGQRLGAARPSAARVSRKRSGAAGSPAATPRRRGRRPAPGVVPLIPRILAASASSAAKRRRQRRSPAPAASARCSQIGPTRDAASPARRAPRPASGVGVAEAERLQRVRSSPPPPTSRPRPSGSDQPPGACAATSVTQQEFAGEQREGRQPGDRRDAERQRPSRAPGWLAASPPMSAIFCAALELRRMADAEEDRATSPANARACAAARPGCRPAPPRPKASAARPICSMLLQAKKRRASRRRHSAKAASSREARPSADQEAAPAAPRRGMRADDRLGPQHRHAARRSAAGRTARRRSAMRALGLGIRQPGMQRRQPRLGAVAHQQEDEGEVQHARVAARRDARAAPPRTGRGSPCPTTGCAARYSMMVPNSASAMPTPQRMKNFHAASIAAGVPCTRDHQHARRASRSRSPPT